MRALQLVGFVFGSFLMSCRSGEKEKSISAPLPPTLSASAAASPSGTIVPQPSSQPAQAILPKKQRQAPDRYEMVVPRIGWPVQSAYSNLIYEGNNLVVRQSPKSKVATRLSGEDIAKRWREIASATHKVFVLRDALFSQQDHAFDHEPYALMLPPSWVSIATAAALEKTPLRPMTLPADDAEWIKADLEVVFGSFPISQSLFDHAKSSSSDPNSEESHRAIFARKSLRDLMNSSTELVQAQGRGAETVARLGAERISAGDRRYFGEDLRRTRVIPISVENPNEHEIRDEAKGFLPSEKRDLSPRAVELVRNAVLRRRLADGDLALERYDISRAEDRQRAIHVLEALIPKGEVGPSLLWLWVNGPLDSLGTGGKNGISYVEAFRRELTKANIELSRLRLFSKPQVEIGDGESGTKTLENAIVRFRKQDVWLSVNLGTAALDAHLN